jgi:hypothetical protein
MTRMLPTVMLWAGVWAGHGTLNGNDTMLLRNQLCLAFEGRGITMDFEVYEPSTMRLVYGVRTLLLQDLQGDLQTVTFSTRFGLIRLEQTPDDDGVLALSGVTDDDQKVNVTMVPQDDDSMQLNAIWRPAGVTVNSEATQNINGTLRRTAIFKPGTPHPR